MSVSPLNILLADDDLDDCLFFKQALEGPFLSTSLTTVPDGEHLMRFLIDKTHNLPDVLFLDLNMPRKNGFECLTEIMQNPRLETLPVVVFSTSYEQEVVNQLFQNGAHYFIRKPPEFIKFKKIILQTLTLIAQGNTSQPPRESFVITLQGE